MDYSGYFYLQHPVAQFLLDFSIISFWIEGKSNIWFISFIMIMYMIYPLVYKILHGACSYKKYRFAFILLVWLILIIVLNLRFKTIYTNDQIAIWRIPIFLLGSFLGEQIYNKEAFRKIDFIMIGGGLLIKVCQLVLCVIGVKQTSSLACSRIVASIFSVALIVILVMLLGSVDLKKAKKMLPQIGGLSLELYVSQVSIRGIMINLGMQTQIWYNYCFCVLLAALVSVAVHKTMNVTFAERK